MNLNFDIKSISKIGRLFVSALILLMPIFYLDIYMYNRDFYNLSPFYISIVASYCLSLGFYVFSCFISNTFLRFSKLKERYTFTSIFYYGAIFSVTFGLLYLALKYFLYAGLTKESMTYKKYLFIFLSTIFVINFINGVLGRIKNHIHKRKNRQLDLDLESK